MNKTLFVSTLEDFINRSDKDSTKCHISIPYINTEVVLINFETVENPPKFYFKIYRNIVIFVCEPSNEEIAIDFLKNNIPKERINFNDTLIITLGILSEINTESSVLIIDNKILPISLVKEK